MEDGRRKDERQWNICTSDQRGGKVIIRNIYSVKLLRSGTAESRRRRRSSLDDGPLAQRGGCGRRMQEKRMWSAGQLEKSVVAACSSRLLRGDRASRLLLELLSKFRHG